MLCSLWPAQIGVATDEHPGEPLAALNAQLLFAVAIFAEDEMSGPALPRTAEERTHAWLTQLFNTLCAKAAGKDSIEVALYICHEADKYRMEELRQQLLTAPRTAPADNSAASASAAGVGILIPDDDDDDDDAGIAEEAAEDEDADVDANDEAAASAEAAVVRVVAPAPRTPPKSKPMLAPLLLRPVPKATLATLLLRPASHGAPDGGCNSQNPY